MLLIRAKMKKLPVRHSPVHLPPRGLGVRPVIIFLTVCTKEKKQILARREIHELLRDVWKETEGWLVGRYVIMPDHVHLFCAPRGEDVPSLEEWVRFWKARATRRWPYPEERPLWQRSFWDTQLRRLDKYDEKWDYVRYNPVRKGLVQDPEEWPYQGVMNVLSWDG